MFSKTVFMTKTGQRTTDKNGITDACTKDYKKEHETLQPLTFTSYLFFDNYFRIF